MDSDDNCLVIDESAMDMEVSSTTQSRAETPVNEIEINKDMLQHENEAYSSQRSDDSGTPKQKERNNDKIKSKDDKNKSITPNKEKKRTSMSKRAHYIRLTPTVFREKTLNVSLSG